MTGPITIPVDAHTIAAVALVVLVLCALLFEAFRLGFNRGYNHGWTDCGDRMLNQPPYSYVPGRDDEEVWLGKFGSYPPHGTPPPADED